jgi:hypothetical protein
MQKVHREVEASTFHIMLELIGTWGSVGGVWLVEFGARIRWIRWFGWLLSGRACQDNHIDDP